jgi:hypothetical protein
MKILILDALNSPQSCLEFSGVEWGHLVAQGRATALLSSLGLLLEAEGVMSKVPGEVRRHLESDIRIHHKQCEGLYYELKWLRRAMANIGENVVLLKGTGYIVSGLPNAAGRLVSDIDLLVPKARLLEVENALERYGWESADLDLADQVYYRKWMHEIPPMIQAERGSVLDVHHTLLPPTANAKLDASKLFDSLLEVQPGIYVLSPVDMVIHSATHLFHEGEFGHGLRDLLDLYRLMEHFSSKTDDFWEELALRAVELDMQRPLFYAFRYTHKFFSVSVPHQAYQIIGKGSPGTLGKLMMDFLFVRGFVPDHSSSQMPLMAQARFCLYVRSHYLRMPMHLLLPHLARKAWSAYIVKDESLSELKEQDAKA